MEVLGRHLVVLNFLEDDGLYVWPILDLVWLVAHAVSLYVLQDCGIAAVLGCEFIKSISVHQGDDQHDIYACKQDQG